MTEDELQRELGRLLSAEHPDVLVEECGDQDVRLRFSLKDGQSWSSATLLLLVDTGLRAAAGLSRQLSHLGVTVLKPPQDADVVGLSRVIGRNQGIVHAETWLFSHAVVDPMLHATASMTTPEHGRRRDQA